MPYYYSWTAYDAEGRYVGWNPFEAPFRDVKAVDAAFLVDVAKYRKIAKKAEGGIIVLSYCGAHYPSDPGQTDYISRIVRIKPSVGYEIVEP